MQSAKDQQPTQFLDDPPSLPVRVQSFRRGEPQATKAHPTIALAEAEVIERPTREQASQHFVAKFFATRGGPTRHSFSLGGRRHQYPSRVPPRPYRAT
jgi:hypothetical protein